MSKMSYNGTEYTNSVLILPEDSGQVEPNYEEDVVGTSRNMYGIIVFDSNLKNTYLAFSYRFQEDVSCYLVQSCSIQGVAVYPRNDYVITHYPNSCLCFVHLPDVPSETGSAYAGHIGVVSIKHIS